MFMNSNEFECRSPDFLPYEDNAIKLSPSRQNPSGYINASPISVSENRRRNMFHILCCVIINNLEHLGKNWR